MKKSLIALPVALLVLVGMTACTGQPLPGGGVPLEIQKNSAVVSVNTVQPDAVSGVDGAIYMVHLKESLEAKDMATAANEVTKRIADSVDDKSEWGVRFRSGNKEIGISKEAYLADHPELAEGYTPKPVEEGVEVPPVRDSFAEQLAAIGEIQKVEGALLVKTYDALAGYVDVSFVGQERAEEFYNASALAIDASGWKNRGDFSLRLTLVTQDKKHIIESTGVSIVADINASADPNGVVSGLLAFPETSMAMYRAVLAVEGTEFSHVTVGSRGGGERLVIVSSKSIDPVINLAIYTAIHSVVTEDAPYVRLDITSAS